MSFKNFKGAVFSDDRGFLRFVNDFDFSDVKRFYQVENHKKGFIRAWHDRDWETAPLKFLKLI